MNDVNTSHIQTTKRSGFRFKAFAVVAGLISLTIIPVFSSYSQLWNLTLSGVDPENTTAYSELDAGDPIVRYFLIRRCLDGQESDYVKALCVAALERKASALSINQGWTFFNSNSEAVHEFGFRILGTRQQLTLDNLNAELERSTDAINYSVFDQCSHLSDDEQFELFKRLINHPVSTVYWLGAANIGGRISDITNRLWTSKPADMLAFVREALRAHPRTDIALALYFTIPDKYEPELRTALRSRPLQFANHKPITSKMLIELSIARRLVCQPRDFDLGLSIYQSWINANLKHLTTDLDAQTAMTGAFGGYSMKQDLCELDCNERPVLHFVEQLNQAVLRSISLSKPQAVKTVILEYSGARRYLGQYSQKTSGGSLTKGKNLYTERPFSPLLPLHSLKITGVIFDDAFLAELDKSATLMQKIGFFKFVGAQKCIVSISGLAALVRNTSQRFWQSKVSKTDAAEYLRFLTVLKRFKYFGLSAAQLQPAFGSKQDRVKHKAAFSFNIKSNSRTSVKTGVDSGFRKLELLQAAAANSG